MAYEIVFHRDAEKGLKSLKSQKSIYLRLLRFFDELAQDPRAVQGKKLLGEWDGCYSYRAGPIRVIYEIYEHKLLIHVLSVGSRGDIY